MSAPRPAGGPDDGAGEGFDWFRVLDIAVWTAVVVIAALAIEWLIGYVVRERISRGADKYLSRVAGDTPTE